jgi:hypothetical protein
VTPLALALLLPCLQEPPANGESFALFQGLHESARIHLSVPSGPCERAARRLAVRLPGRFEVSIAPEEPAPEAVRILVGAPTDPELLPCARAVGLEPLVGGFRLLGRDYTRPGDALRAVIEDPQHPGRPLYFVVGNDLELVSAYLDGIPRLTRPYLWLHSDGELALTCPLALDGRAPTPDTPGLCDYLTRRAQYFEGGWTNDSEGLVVHAHGALERERWRAYGLALARVRRRLAGWFEADETPACELFLYEHLEDFERCLGESALELENRLRPRVHVLLAPGMPDDGGAGLARVLARALAGPPAEEWLEDGLAVAAAGVWWRRPLDEWIAHLSSSKQLPAVTEICAPQACERFSEHALMPARALLFRAAVQGTDARRARALWKGAPLEPQMAAALYKRGVQASVEDARPAKGKASGKDSGKDSGKVRVGARAQAALAHERRTAVRPFRHGLALVEDERTRYSARAVDAVLGEAHALEPGPDALSLTLFATTEDPLPPLCPARARAVHGSASDLALASATAAARAAELAVLLSLEVLARPSAAWADVLSWTGVDEQAQFWERYEQVAEHYALLSELLGFELYSFGSNLNESVHTEGNEGESTELFALRRAKWEKLIVRLHKAYHGSLVFTARSPAEAEDAGFLEGLDAIGLFLYPQLRAANAPEEAELQRVLRYELSQAIDLGVRWNKPVLLVQVGFPARADSWSQPMVPRGALDLAAQQRYFETLADVLEQELDNRAMLRGFFLWNWPLAAERAGALDAGFSLRQKPVESALRRLFAR